MPQLLIIQIPCYNEADSLPTTIAALPRSVAGFERVEFLVINDGSTDATAQVAHDLGVDHILSFPRNRGLAAAYSAGIETAVMLGADVILNTDADNQYDAQDIPQVLAPILAHQADLVIGDRQTHLIRHFSLAKKILQKTGSWVVSHAAWLDIPDATSGFRAMTAHCALRMNVTSSFTYTLETIIQAGHKNFAVRTVPIRTNPEMRPSRLFRSIPAYVLKSAATIVRIYAMYRALQVFMRIGMFFLLGAAIVGGRFLYFTFFDHEGGHIQSLFVCAIFAVCAFQSMLFALLADLAANNRHLTEEVLYRQKKLLADRLRHENRHPEIPGLWSRRPDAPEQSGALPAVKA
ncbi:MAG: glycosyltransferase family 2 protein [Planctomycetota bacterium]